MPPGFPRGGFSISPGGARCLSPSATAFKDCCVRPIIVCGNKRTTGDVAVVFALDPETGDELWTSECGAGTAAAYDVAFSPNGRFVYVAAPPKVYKLNVATGAIVSSVFEGNFRVSTDADGNVWCGFRQYDSDLVLTGTVLDDNGFQAQAVDENDEIRATALSPAGYIAALFQSDGTNTWKYSSSEADGTTSQAGIANKDGTRFTMATQTSDLSLHLLQLDQDGNKNWRLDPIPLVNGGGRSYAALEDGSILLTGERDAGAGKSLLKLDTSGGEVDSFDTGTNTAAVDFDEDGNIYLAGFKDAFMLDSNLDQIWKKSDLSNQPLLGVGFGYRIGS